MLIPYSTDAPIYHYPIATVTLIVVNVIFFFSFCLPHENEVDESAISHFVDRTGRTYSMEEMEAKATELIEAGESPDDLLDEYKPVFNFSTADRLMLQFGQGYLPWQWCTSMFMHQGFGHLIGNMTFLWAFGLLLEGKLGWWVFALVYLATGIVQAFIVQTLMWFSHGAALGASGAIFSMLALVVIFAPLNSFDVLLFFGFRAITFELPILMFGFFYVAMNVAFFFLGGADMSSEALHLIGFLVGAPVGLFMLTRGYVDCEGYDIISHLTGREGRSSQVGKQARRQRAAKQTNQAISTAPAQDPAQTLALLNRQVEQAIGQGQFDLAVALQNKICESNPDARWSQPQLAAVMQHYVKAGDLAKAIPLIELHVSLFEKHRFLLQSKLIKIWLQQQRPRHAIRYMRGLNAALLSDSEKAEIQKLAAFAKKQIQDGVLEVE